jgi:hypothetical protein
MMKKWDYRKLVGFVEKEKRIFFALGFLVLAFTVNYVLYANHKKTTESCTEGKCLIALPEKPQLTKESGYYYVDDIFKDQPSGFYRLTFQGKSDQAEQVLLKLNTYSEKENQLETLTFEPSSKLQKQEIFFFLPDGFDSLLFQKENSNSSGNIFIQGVGITKLNITDKSELALLKKTVLGETDMDTVKISQLVSDYSFPWLKENKIVLGQIFQADESVISAVEFKIDINKNLNPGSRQYVLSLREAKYSGDKVSLVGPTIVDVTFSMNSIEKYRQVDGSFLFPIYATLEKGKYYLLGVDNSKVGVSNQNFLEFRGAKDDNSYPNGSAVMRRYKELYKIDGDLYFKIHGANLLVENGEKILNGAKIEYLGKGTGKYSYATKGKFIDLLDLETASPGTEFSDNDKVVYALAKDDASFSYAVNTLYPISKMNFSATQIKAGWKKVKISYSLDKNNWLDLPFSEKSEVVINPADNLAPDQSLTADSTDADTADSSDAMAGDSSADVSDGTAEESVQETVQTFDADIIPTKEVKTVYFKVTYDPSDMSKGKSFALKNLKITADLKMK